jgi:hypothetical protein
MNFLMSMIFMIVPFLALSADEEHIYKALESKQCGMVSIQYSEGFDKKDQVCRLDNSLSDIQNLTPMANVSILIGNDISSHIKSSEKILYEVLLQKIAPLVEERIKPLDKIGGLELPGKIREETLKDLKEFKDKLFSSKRSARSKLETFFDLYPDLADEILKENPEFRPLVCRFDVWKKRKDKWMKGLRISSKVLAWTAIIASLPTLGAGFVGAFPVTILGPIYKALGLAQIGLSASSLTGHLLTLNELSSARLAKDYLRIDNELSKTLKNLQKEPEKNQNSIREIQAMQLSEAQKTSLKDVKRDGAKKKRQMIGSLLQLTLGVIEFKFGDFLNEHFKNYESSGPAETINSPIKPRNPLDLDDGG